MVKWLLAAGERLIVMLLHLRTLAASSCLLGGQAPRILPTRMLRLSNKALRDTLRFNIGRPYLTTQLLARIAGRRSPPKGTRVGVVFIAVGGTGLARFLLRRDVHRADCKVGTVRPALRNENGRDSEPVFNWRRFLALILPVKWLLSAAVAVSGSSYFSVKFLC